MSRGRAALAVATLLAVPPGCDGERLAGAPPEQGLSLRVEAGAPAVAFGRAFPLRVVRLWSRALEPAVWDDADLAPLTVEAQEVTRRIGERAVEETRRYRAWAFATDEIVVPPVEMRARPRDGGPVRTVSSAPLRLRVHSSLPPDDPLEAEPPPLPPPMNVAARLLTLAATLAALAWWWKRRRGRGRAAVAAATRGAGTEAGARAWRRWHALQQRQPLDDDARRRWVAMQVQLLRDYLEERGRVSARRMSSHELRAAGPGLGWDPALVRVWTALLEQGDRVKFAALVPGDVLREDCARAVAAILAAEEESAG